MGTEEVAAEIKLFLKEELTEFKDDIQTSRRNLNRWLVGSLSGLAIIVLGAFINGTSRISKLENIGITDRFEKFEESYVEKNDFVNLVSMINETYVTELKNRNEELIRLQIEMSKIELKYGVVYRGVNDAILNIRKLNSEMDSLATDTGVIINNKLK